MCGITGIVSFNEKDINRTVLEKMNKELSSRGPDDEGFYYSDHIGMGHRRLSIIDLKTGHQPMTTEDGRFTLVYNGEFYNFLEHREQLLKEGVPLKTKSDAEVFLYLFAKKGPACLEDINGMFALAVWDKEKKELFLARDRLGQKPLYYALMDDGIIFASELKALLKFPELKKEICPLGLKHFFTYEYVPAPYSIIKNVHKLKQAHFLKHSQKGFELHRYWNQPEGSTCQDDIKTAEEKLLGLLDQAVNYRLIADVPVGVFLSGGIDSSVIVSLIAKHRPGKDIKTFAINFKEQSYDESYYSSLIAKAFGTDHHEETLSADLMLDILPQVTDYMDEPFADGSILPTYLLSRFTRKYVKVALGGDGGDELFAGYPTFLASRLANVYQKSPALFKSLTNKIVGLLSVSDKNMSLDFKARQFLLGVEYDDVLKNQVWLAALGPKEQESFFHPSFLAKTPEPNPLELVLEEMKYCRSKKADDRLWYFYQKFYMCDDILVKVDRASMANSLEVRAPFLDKNVVEYVCSLPYNYKLRGMTTKRLLKRTFKNILPKEVIKRPKKGFGIPVSGWLKNELKPLLLDTINQKTVEADGFFSWPHVNGLITDHLSGKRNNRKQLFAIVSLS